MKQDVTLIADLAFQDRHQAQTRDWPQRANDYSPLPTTYALASPLLKLGALDQRLRTYETQNELVARFGAIKYIRFAGGKADRRQS